ncbi:MULTISPECIES: hypothetical protein [unclassified Herbaspirillum]|uniref:hypothetical protein n=1 Tax=unclassified Herbaspirillum TaxID=2624150 RepID=UPI0018558512|nr:MULTISPECIES: hypothetical protein [unclassified Herbaspirillum]MBB5392482.1 hypothetical protein [Herbaspirillum sp. SJZ102]
MATHMAQYGAAYRGRHITVDYQEDARSGDVRCVVKVGDVAYPNIRGNPFRSAAAAQATGAAFARAVIDAELDGDAVEHRGYFIRVSSIEQRDGSWVGSYQFHRNDNPVPFRRVSCDGFRGNSPVEAEEYAIGMAQKAMDADIAAGKL